MLRKVLNHGVTSPASAFILRTARKPRGRPEYRAVTTFCPSLERSCIRPLRLSYRRRKKGRDQRKEGAARHPSMPPPPPLSTPALPTPTYPQASSLRGCANGLNQSTFDQNFFQNCGIPSLGCDMLPDLMLLQNFYTASLLFAISLSIPGVENHPFKGTII